jgi:hypothetical protein
MRHEDPVLPTEAGTDDPGAPHRQDDVALAQLSHPVRGALMELLRSRPTLTSTEAASALGGNTGLYSFHLRQLARFGLIEEAPHAGGRRRPWRLAASEPTSAEDTPDAISGLARGLEDESYRHWLDHRGDAPAKWKHDEAFSEVVYLTPRELTDIGDTIRQVLSAYRHREQRPAARPAGAAPVAVVARIFPLLEPPG